MENKKNNIEERLGSIESKLDQILPEVENVVAHRVYKAATARMVSAVKVFSVIGALILGAVGYQSYKQIVDIGGTKVAEVFVKSAIPELQKDAKEIVDQRVSEVMIDAKAQANAKIDQQIAELTSIFQKKYDNLIAELEMGRISITATIPKEKLSGFVLFGEGERTQDGVWKWTSQNLAMHGNEEEYPSPNKQATTLKPVLVRTDAPKVKLEKKEIINRIPIFQGFQMKWEEQRVTVASIPFLDQSASKPLGTIIQGKAVEITKVELLLDKYVWVELKEI